jgi:hypothetical protein
VEPVAAELGVRVQQDSEAPGFLGAVAFECHGTGIVLLSTSPASVWPGERRGQDYGGVPKRPPVATSKSAPITGVSHEA